MADRVAITLASFNLALTGVVATFTIFAFTGQNDLFTEQGKQSALLGQLIEVSMSLEKKADTLANRAAQIERKIEIAQISPNTMMAKAGFPVDKDVQLVWFGKEVIAFPRTAEAEKSLQDKKYVPVKLNPAISGYVLDGKTAAVVKQVVIDNYDPDSRSAAVPAVNLPTPDDQSPDWRLGLEDQ